MEVPSRTSRDSGRESIFLLPQKNDLPFPSNILLYSPDPAVPYKEKLSRYCFAMNVVLISVGDARASGTWSGVPKRVYEELRRRGHNVVPADITKDFLWHWCGAVFNRIVRSVYRPWKRRQGELQRHSYFSFLFQLMNSMPFMLFSFLFLF